jgi:hypothetical protein
MLVINGNLFLAVIVECYVVAVAPHSLEVSLK